LSWKDYLDSLIQCLFSILQMFCWWYLWHLDRYISRVGVHFKLTLLSRTAAGKQPILP
jgi:hypothetical protein